MRAANNFILVEEDWRREDEGVVGGQKEESSQGHGASLAVWSVLPAYMEWEG